MTLKENEITACLDLARDGLLAKEFVRVFGDSYITAGLQIGANVSFGQTVLGAKFFDTVPAVSNRLDSPFGASVQIAPRSIVLWPD